MFVALAGRAGAGRRVGRRELWGNALLAALGVAVMVVVTVQTIKALLRTAPVTDGQLCSLAMGHHDARLH